MLCKEKQVFQAFPPFGSQIQTESCAILRMIWRPGKSPRWVM